ncbi:BTAD domain-containing putative transcriptional regulator [Nocardia sp. NPDC057030]|uniref:AfsR/SARP family transcriptional regulator n=1 Tax=unclassified Nocardia TaxID=2637762 RepID=UPI003643C65E
MEFSVLGTLTVTANGAPIELGGATQRAVLGYLLLNANQMVPISQLIRVLWRDDPPSTARKMVHNSVWSIRRSMVAPRGRAVKLATQPPGYVFRVDDDSVDLFRFRRLVRQGRQELDRGAIERGIDLLRQGLALWRGQALADVVDQAQRWSELVAIEDERLGAYEDCLENELACGRHRELTAELERLTAAQPRRESLHRLYMLALYRSGRQLDALDVFQRVRTSLVDGSGVEPGRELQRVHELILRHDRSLHSDPGRTVLHP